VAPVQDDPTDLRSLRVAEQPERTSESVPSSGSRGGVSILKKSESTEESADEQPTARRMLRTAPRASTSSSSGLSTVPSSHPTLETTPAMVARTQAPPALLASHGPALRMETEGPKALKVGTESTYRIHIYNDGDVEANDIFVRAGVPASAKVIAEGSATEPQPASDTPNEQRFVWTVGRLAPKASATFTMRITPTDGSPFNLFVDWTTRPVSAVAQLEVQRPQLELAVFGPKDIAYGEPVKYTLRLSNPGTGDADDVMVEFGYGQEKLEPRQIGTLAAGQQQELSLELTARQAGALPVMATATASGGLRVEAAQEVLVRRASLEATVVGDASIFAGSPATYRITVRNAGNAPANQVSALVSLPPGCEVLKAGDGASPEAGGLAWNVGLLPANGERVLDLQCVLTSPGDNAIRVQVVGSGDLDTTGSFVTRVEALADLKLTVNDPQGPVAVGQDAVYEIHVHNRGTKAATKINVVAQFSSGIEPLEATGVPSEIVPGQVLFQAIPRIDPGQEVTLIVRARADGAGPKRFRTEVACEELDIQLVAQETTHFFSETAGRTSSTGGATTKR
jgi:uncharacterized repeat protein (TIGR01451 family)